MLNKFIVAGRLCADPEIRRTKADVPVCSFRIANQRDYKRDGEEKPGTDFFDVTAWRATAEFIAKHFTKGRMITLVGRMESHDWTEKESGKKRTSYEIQAEDAYFSDSKPADTPSEGGYPTGGYPAGGGYPSGGTPAGGAFPGNAPVAYGGYSYPGPSSMGAVPDGFMP